MKLIVITLINCLLLIESCSFNNKNTNNLKQHFIFPKGLVRLHGSEKLIESIQSSECKLLILMNGDCDCIIQNLQDLHINIKDKGINCFVIVVGQNLLAFDNIMLRKNVYKDISFFRDLNNEFIKQNSLKIKDYAIYKLDNENRIIHPVKDFNAIDNQF